MLPISFKPAKCKTALKLAVSRIKLLKNKRQVQVKQLKREVANLLQSEQDQIATIRVEHVVREEKTMTAYDFIEIYCELIAARLPIIESQKNCPIDLKEAISSVIFASPRCADIPELADVRKHITAKYGKEFVSAAVELRPECGVNRLLVEKLSAKAPDGPTKIKVLNAIAKEHNVTWESKSFGENDVKSSHDLQVGPNIDEKASYVELLQVHAYSQHKEMDDVPTNLNQHNACFAAEMVGGNGSRSKTSGRSNPYMKSSGTGSEEMHFRYSYSDQNKSSSSPMSRQKNWNMEFKDAASAAQEAAESAERASMAARAAAELSSREKITRKYSNGLMQNSDLGDEEVPKEYAFHDGRHLSAESVNRNYGKHNELFNAREQNNVAADLLVTDEGNTQRRKFQETNSYHKTDVIFDESGSEHRQGSMSFDDSDGPSSESEEDLGKPKVASVPVLSTKQKHGTSGCSSSMNGETVDTMEEHFKRKIDITSVSSHEAKAKVKHSISGSLHKSVKEADRSECSKSGESSPSKEKASHVHPKLPDYDSFLAHFLSLKKGG